MDIENTPGNGGPEGYIQGRVDDQIRYFDASAVKYQGRYRLLKRISIVCNILTTMAIALAFTVPETYKIGMGILALVLSTLVLATYQWEEFENNGARWEKFRLVAEQLKSERIMFLTGAGPYAALEGPESFPHFVETVEGIIRGTDIAYFALMVDPGRRIEKRLGQEGGRP